MHYLSAPPSFAQLRAFPAPVARSTEMLPSRQLHAAPRALEVRIRPPTASATAAASSASASAALVPTTGWVRPSAASSLLKNHNHLPRLVITAAARSPASSSAEHHHQHHHDGSSSVGGGGSGGVAGPMMSAASAGSNAAGSSAAEAPGSPRSPAAGRPQGRAKAMRARATATTVAAPLEVAELLGSRPRLPLPPPASPTPQQRRLEQALRLPPPVPPPPGSAVHPELAELVVKEEKHLSEVDLAARMRGLRERVLAAAGRPEQQQQQQQRRGRREQQQQQQKQPFSLRTATASAATAAASPAVLRVSSGIGGSVSAVARAAARRLLRAGQQQQEEGASMVVLSAAGGDAALRALRAIASLPRLLPEGARRGALVVSAPALAPVIGRGCGRHDTAFELRMRLMLPLPTAAGANAPAPCCRPLAERAGAMPCGGGGVGVSGTLGALLPVVRVAAGGPGDAAPTMMPDAAALATAVAEALDVSPLGGCALPLARGKHAARALEAVALLARERGQRGRAALRLEVGGSGGSGGRDAATILYIYKR